jgi:sulfur transfer protein SufE
MRYAEIKNILSVMDDPVLKLETVMDFGKSLSDIPEGAKCDEIKGCASRVRLCVHNGVIYGDADSALVRGIAAIIISMANDKVAQSAAEFESLGLNLGAGRLNGVNSMLNYIDNL